MLNSIEILNKYCEVTSNMFYNKKFYDDDNKH